MSTLCEEDGLHASTAPTEVRPGVERVAAVVAAADEQDDASADESHAEVAHEGGAGVGEPGRGTLHECTFGRCRHDGILGRTHGGHGVHGPHGDPGRTTRR